MSFNVNADLFRAAHTIVSRNETRYYLKGVCIQPAKAGMPGVTLTATDGHRLISVYDREGSADGDYIVGLTPAQLRDLKSGRGETHPRRIISTTPDAPLTVARNDDEAHVYALLLDWQIKDATFPDWRRVLPSKLGAPTVLQAFNLAYLASFDEAARIITGQRAVGSSIYSPDNGSPAVIRFDGVDHAVGVVMPHRTDLTEAMKLPSFI